MTQGDKRNPAPARSPISGGRAVSFNSEFDALPGIGHACGHNLIATIGVAAAIGVKEALENQGVEGKVVYVLTTF